MALTVTINGEARNLSGAISVRDMLTSLGMDPAKIAIERNLEIVPRSQYGTVAVIEGDRFEIVHFIGGGNSVVDVGAPVAPLADKPFVVAGKTFGSRLIIGTGKYKD